MKLKKYDVEDYEEMSLPLWERGLKCRLGCRSIGRVRSLPLRERGLKSVTGVK